ncbi:hypothetical protein MMC17_005701 [Xylographa soralifera]|nr:hypothetical protein [Xylographa soralifera]
MSMSNPSHRSIPYPKHDSVFQNGALIILQQIIITPLIVRHILIQQVRVHRTLPRVPDASPIKTSHKREVGNKSQRSNHNANKDKPKDHRPKDYEVTVRQVVRRQDGATHSALRLDDREMVVMRRETFDNLLRAKHQESTHSNRVSGNMQKAKIHGLVGLSPKPAIQHEAKATGNPLKSALHVRRPGGDHSTQREAMPAIERHVKFQSSELGTAAKQISMNKTTVKKQAGSSTWGRDSGQHRELGGLEGRKDS